VKENLIQHTNKSVRVRGLFVAVLVLACAFGTVAQAVAQKIASPATPDQITPPAGNTAFLVGHAKGTQGYVCLPTAPGAATASWTVNNARPEATLFASIFGGDVEIITHFLSPDTHPNANAPNPLPFGSATWQGLDTSRVWAQVFNAADGKPASILAGSHPSCPNTGSIACLLLTSIGNDKGPTGGKLLADTTFVQRLNTKGGSAPTTGCSVSTDVGKQALVPYTSDYFFFRGVD
jgi:Protein of unknown function (DUF3455)